MLLDKLPFISPNHSLTAASVIVIITLGRWFIRRFVWWEKNFARNKLPRSHKHSPSNKLPPNMKSVGTTTREIISASKYGHASDLLKQLQQASKSLNGEKCLDPDEKADKLDMSHIYISFTQYLWAVIFVGFPTTLRGVTGVACLWLRNKMHIARWIEPKPFDPATVVATLCLEGTMVINYRLRDSNDKNLAGFYFPDFPIIKPDGGVFVGLLEVVVDLSTKRMVAACLDGGSLTPSETLILCWFNAVTANHTKIHALSNWGVNCDNDKVDSFVSRNSLVTVIYNHFGYSEFATFVRAWQICGLLDEDWKASSLKEVFDIGIDANIHSHHDVLDLYKYSRLVKFIILVRPIFMKQFRKYRNSFAGIDGEALFVSTVVHSLDHIVAERALGDSLWLDIQDERFGKMAQIGRIIRAGFIHEVPGIYFHTRFKGSGHPFYESVYKAASKVDKDLADHMDTCIIN